MNVLNKKRIILKSIVAILIYIIASLSFINSVYAKHIEKAEVKSVGDCGQLLKYKGVIVKVNYVEYFNDGIAYPAYCMDKNKKGVEDIPYTVDVTNMITDIGLWRTMINGYPYKTIQELGVSNKEEAFTATKQSIYCYIHGNNINDYEPIGEAGIRTLNCMKKILVDANNSTETKISNNVKIDKGSDIWKQDSKDKNYVSKEFSIIAQADIKNYKISVENDENKDLELKITNLENKETNEFKPQEKFKILIPIKNLTSSGNIKIKVETKMETKPILYGTAPNSANQDYALIAETYEDSNGESFDYYSKNETKIIIVKQDKDTGEYLENVTFELLDENKNIIYSDLRTDKNGKIVIENLVPGKYYIRESNTINGYEKYEEVIEANISLNEQLTVNVYNGKEETPKIDVEKSNSNQIVKKLPVTGY